MIYPENCENAKSINAFVKEHYRELVIDQEYKISRIIDSHDGEDDYYWVLEGFFGKRHLESCVGGLIPLKNKISDEDYKNINNVFKLNGSRDNEDN